MSSKAFKSKYVNSKKLLAGIALGATAVAVASLSGGLGYYISKDQKQTASSFDDRIQIKTHFALDPTLSESENQARLNNIANKTTAIYNRFGLKEFEVKSAIKHQSKDTKDSNALFGELVYDFNLPSYRQFASVNLLDKEFTNKQKVAAKLQLLSTFSSSNRIELQNISSLYNHKPTLATSLNDQEFLLQNWKTLNQNPDLFEIKTNRNQQPHVEIKLNQSDQKFSLEMFDKEFSKNYNYAPTTSSSRQTAITNFQRTNRARAKPTNSWLMWVNRDALVSKLNMLALLAYAHNEPFTDPKKWADVDDVYQNLPANGEDRAYVDWIKAETKTKPYEHFLITSNDLNQQYNPIDNKLISLLNAFYRSNKHKVLQQPNPQNPRQSQTPMTFADYEMFYSWNINKLALVRGYVYAIDYNSFFNYFTEPKRTTQADKYETDHLVLNQANTSVSTANNFLLLKNSLISNYISYPQFLVKDKKYQDAFYQYINTPSIIASKYQQGIIKTLSIKDSILIGFGVLVGIIGIIVAVLYKFNGLIFALLLGIGYLVQLSIAKAANFGFSTETYAALLVSLIIPIFGFVNLQSDLKRFMNKGYSYKNAYYLANKKMITNNGMMYLLIILMSLVFMYFGIGLNTGFGYSLVFGSIAYLLTTYLLGLIMHFSYATIFEFKPQTHLYEPYLSTALKINNNIFDSKLNEYEEQKNYSLLAQKLFNNNSYKYVYLVLIGIITLVGLLMLGLWLPTNSELFNTLVQVDVNKILNQTELDKINSLVDYGNSDKLITSLYLDANAAEFETDLNTIKTTYGLDNVLVYSNHIPLFTDQLKNTIYSYLIIGVIVTIWSAIWFKLKSCLVILSNVVACTLIFFGINSLFRLPVYQTVITAANSLFVLICVISFNMYANLIKILQFNQKWTNKQINTHLHHSLFQYLSRYNIIYIVMLVCLLTLMIFVPYELVILNAMVVFGILFTKFTIVVLNSLLTYAIYKKANSKYGANWSYDKFDEQSIANINQF